MITKQEAKKIASLSRIYLNEEEAENLAFDLERILEYINKLNALNIDGVEPTAHALPISNVFREDIVKPSLKQEDALSISIQKHEGAFQVPKVIE